MKIRRFFDISWIGLLWLMLVALLGLTVYSSLWNAAIHTPFSDIPLVFRIEGESQWVVIAGATLAVLLCGWLKRVSILKGLRTCFGMACVAMMFLAGYHVLLPYFEAGRLWGQMDVQEGAFYSMIAGGLGLIWLFFAWLVNRLEEPAQELVSEEEWFAQESAMETSFASPYRGQNMPVTGVYYEAFNDSWHGHSLRGHALQSENLRGYSLQDPSSASLVREPTCSQWNKHMTLARQGHRLCPLCLTVLERTFTPARPYANALEVDDTVVDVPSMPLAFARAAWDWQNAVTPCRHPNLPPGANYCPSCGELLFHESNTAQKRRDTRPTLSLRRKKSDMVF